MIMIDHVITGEHIRENRDVLRSNFWDKPYRTKQGSQKQAMEFRQPSMVDVRLQAVVWRRLSWSSTGGWLQLPTPTAALKLDTEHHRIIRPWTSGFIWI